MEFTLDQANAYANQMLYYPDLPDFRGGSFRAVWPAVDDTSRIAISSFNGDPHQEIFICQPCRREEDDLKIAVHFAVGQLRTRIDDDLKKAGDGAKVEWRVKPEIIVEEFRRVLRYHEDGLDKDFLTDRRCTLDDRFWIVKVYARCSFIQAKYLALRKVYLESSKVA